MCFAWGSCVISSTTVFPWTTINRHTCIDWPAKSYIHHLCVDSGYFLEDLPRVIAGRDWWKERVKGNHAVSMTWWWWWWYIYIYIYTFKHVWLNNKDTFCLYNIIKILSSFLISVLVSININDKILFLGVLIDTINIDWFITSTYKKLTNINPCTLNFHSEWPFHYKRTIIKTLISRAKTTIFLPNYLP